MTPVVRAAIWMSGAIVSFTALAVAGRYLASDLDTFEIMLYRSVMGVVIVLATGRLAGTLPEIDTRSLSVHLVRNLFHFAGQNLWYFAIAAIPLAQVFALEFSSPIWALFMAVAVLGERLTGVRILAAALGFSGILLITRPWAGDLGIGVLSAGLAAIGFAGSAVFTRLLTRSVSITSILFWLTAMQSVFALIGAGWDLDIAWPSQQSFPWLALIAVGGLVAHFCLTRALALAPAAVVVPVDFLRLPIVAVTGMILFGENLDSLVLAGAAIIFAANYMNILVESRRRRTGPPPPAAGP